MSRVTSQKGIATASYLLLVLAVLSSACATTSDPTTTSTSLVVASTLPVITTPASETTEIPSVTTPASETTEAPSVTTTETTPATTIPGEPVEFGPQAGQRVMVIGVSHDDFLNMRELPGASFDVVAEIPPDERGLVALGNTRDIGTSFWIEVEYQGEVGWVHMSFIGFEGTTDDLTAFVIDELGERPTTESMVDLGLVVSEVFASDEPRSELVITMPESIGDLAEITYDVIGLGDDSVAGLRVHVFAEPLEDGFALRTVEVTYICGRGVTSSGLCI